MKRVLRLGSWILLMGAMYGIPACKSTKNIQTAINKKENEDSLAIAAAEKMKIDSVKVMQTARLGIEKNKIEVNTLSAKIKVDYQGGDGKNYNVNGFLRLEKDKSIWLSINAALGIEALRALITPDTVKVMNKIDKEFSIRRVDYLQEVVGLPFDFNTLQDLILGNPVFLDSNFTAYERQGDQLALTQSGEVFRSLVLVDSAHYRMASMKLDDVNPQKNRTAYLAYGDYQPLNQQWFSNARDIVVTEKKRLVIRLEFKQVDVGIPLTFPFSVPRNYKRK